MNLVVLIGRLTRDPELRYLPGTGTAVATFSLAVDKQLSKEKRQELEEKGEPTADFINIVVWGKQAENCANYLTKGSLVAVQGRIQTRSWGTENGSKRYATEVVVNSIKFLERKDRTNNDFYMLEGFEPVDESSIPF